MEFKFSCIFIEVNNMAKNIFIEGLQGAGKSTLVREIANRRRMCFLSEYHGGFDALLSALR